MLKQAVGEWAAELFVKEYEGQGDSGGSSRRNSGMQKSACCQTAL
jgi:hypothetical protein